MPCYLHSIVWPRFFTIPPLRPVADMAGEEAPTIWQFDLLGAVVVIPGCVYLLFGLTQGPVTKWSPYTYALVVVGICLLVRYFRRYREPC